MEREVSKYCLLVFFSLTLSPFLSLAASLARPEHKPRATLSVGPSLLLHLRKTTKQFDVDRLELRNYGLETAHLWTFSQTASLHSVGR